MVRVQPDRDFDSIDMPPMVYNGVEQEVARRVFSNASYRLIRFATVGDPLAQHLSQDRVIDASRVRVRWILPHEANATFSRGDLSLEDYNTYFSPKGRDALYLHAQIRIELFRLLAEIYKGRRVRVYLLASNMQVGESSEENMHAAHAAISAHITDSSSLSEPIEHIVEKILDAKRTQMPIENIVSSILHGFYVNGMAQRKLERINNCNELTAFIQELPPVSGMIPFHSHFYLVLNMTTQVPGIINTVVDKISDMMREEAGKLLTQVAFCEKNPEQATEEMAHMLSTEFQKLVHRERDPLVRRTAEVYLQATSWGACDEADFVRLHFMKDGRDIREKVVREMLMPTYTYVSP